MYDKKKFVKDYMQEAQIRLKFSQTAFDSNRYNTVIRECQTVVEMASKALLFSVGFAVPEKHNIKEDLKIAKELFSKNLQNEYEKILRIFGILRVQREPSLYGDVSLNKVAGEFYSKSQSENYLNQTKWFYNLIELELKIFLDKK